MKKLLLLAPLLALSACAVVKVPEISSINQDAGKIAVAYDYGLFQKPEVNWNTTLATASAQCRAWHYQDAVQSVAPQTDCVQNDQNGRCNSWKVQALYDCKLSAEQAQAYNDKLKAKQDAEQLAQQQAIKTQQTFINNLSSFTVIFICNGEYISEKQKKNTAEILLSDYRGNNNSRYLNGLHIFKCNQKNQVLSKDEFKRIDGLTLSFQEKDGTAYYFTNSIGTFITGIIAR
jgi:hypothetical protein